MLEADTIAADVKRAEAALTTRQKEIDAEKKELAEELTSVEASLKEASEARAELVKDLEPRLMALFEQVARVRKGVAISQATRDGLCSAVPRATAAIGVPAGTAERRHHPVRELSAHPVLDAAASPDRTRRRPHVTVRREPALALRRRPRPAGAATANIDGGSRGNPGPAGYGVRIEQADGTIVELKEFLGTLHQQRRRIQRAARGAALGGRASGARRCSCARTRSCSSSRCAANTA